MHQKRSRPLARGSSSFPQTKARNDETFAIDDRRHGGVQDIGKTFSDKSAKPEALQGRRKERRKHSLRRPPWIEKNFRLRCPCCTQAKSIQVHQDLQNLGTLRVSKLIPEMQQPPQENFIAIHVCVIRFRVYENLKDLITHIHKSSTLPPYVPSKPNGNQSDSCKNTTEVDILLLFQ